MSEKQPIALIFACVWPEPWSSAAGLRTRELADFLREAGYRVLGWSSCVSNRAREEWEAAGVETSPVALNDSAGDATWRELRPTLVIYDRFLMEEQFGWRAREAWPDALHLIDTIDLHSVRRAREKSKRGEWAEILGAEEEDELLREIASLHRADACLVVSDWEETWLASQGYDPARTLFLPFSAEPSAETKPRAERSGACFIGNYRHAPNLDAARWLVDELWPSLKDTFGTLTLYGAYPPELLTQLHGKRGLRVVANIPDHRAALASHVVSLAPLRFGAGIKGKVLESWAVGTPVLGTPVAFEGMGVSAGLEDGAAWPEEFRTPAELAEKSRALVSDSATWEAAAARGASVLAKKFRRAPIKEKFLAYLEQAYPQRARWRASLTGRMLRQQQHNSTKYFSLWIEAKNRKPQ